MHDLLIKNARIYDGLGNPPQSGDLAVKDGRIAAIGRNLGAAHETVDADGLALIPGIIDTHTHYDAQITWDPMASPSPALGVTTVIMGNCGFTIAPCRPADRDLVMRNLTHVEGMSLAALREGIRWDFQSFPEYLDYLERRGVGPNVACFVGHSSVRTFVLGAAAPERPATAAEIQAMRSIVVEGMKAGACGFSTTTSFQHNGENGIPMPSRLADDAEMQALCGSLREIGRGVLMMTKAATTPVPWIEDLAARAGRPFVVAALLHSNVTPEASFEDLEHIGQACARGHRMYGAVACTPLKFEFTMHEPYVFEGLGSWAPAMSAHGDAKRLYRDPAFRAAVKAELAQSARRLFTGEWDKMHVVQTAARAQPALRRPFRGRALRGGRQASARFPARSEPGRGSGHRVHRGVAQLGRRGGRAHDPRPQQPAVAVGCRSAPHVSVRRGVRIALPRVTGCAGAG